MRLPTAIFHWLDPWNLVMAEQIRRVLNLTLVRTSCLQPLPRSVGVSAYNLFRFVKLGLFGEKGASRAPISGSFCSQSRHGASGEHDGRAGGHRTLPHIERPCGVLDPAIQSAPSAAGSYGTAASSSWKADERFACAAPISILLST